MGQRAATAGVGGVQVSGDETSQLRRSGCLPDVPLGGGCLRHVCPGGGPSTDLGHAGDFISLSWHGNTSGFPPEELGLPAEAATPVVWTWISAWKMKAMLDEEIPPIPAQVFL